MAYLRDLVKELVIRDLKGGYKHSVLGMAWAVLTPLFYLLIFSCVFKYVFQLHTSRYTSITFTGIVAWGWFQASLSQAVGIIRNSRDLVLQPGFPVASLPVISVTTSFINFLITIPILMVMLLLDGAPLHFVIVALPVLMAIQFIMTLSLAYLVAAINVTFRDTQHILVVFLQLYFYVTPVFYDISKVPEKFKPFFLLNPMSNLVGAYRDVLVHGVAPNWLVLSLVAASSIALLFLGHRFFMRASYRFVEEL